MKKICLTFDLEEFVIPKEQNIPYEENELFEISKKGTENIIKLLNQFNIQATFFTTLKFAQYYPELIKNLVFLKHEIGLHGYDHFDNYEHMPDEEILTRLTKAKNLLEKKFKIKIKGFRSPRFQKISYHILKKAGFEYDSSFHPTYVPGHYNNFLGERKVTELMGIKRIPLTVTPLLRMPFSWIWFRNLGLNYTKLCTKLAFLDQNFINLYFHPWEFTSLKKFKFSNFLANLSIRKCGSDICCLFEKYIHWVKEKGYNLDRLIDNI